jgi:rubrerythrin
MADLTLSTVIQKAIENEITSYNLYQMLIKMVKEKDTKDTFSYLASEEVKHKEFLEDYLKGKYKTGGLDLRNLVDYKVAEYLEAPVPSEKMRPQDAFLLAASREKKSHEFYEQLAGIHPQGDVKNLLKQLAKEELSHKEKVEYLYANTAFPQTDGG